MAHDFAGPYDAEHLDRISFPLGGIGAGMLCLDGTGSLSHVSVRGTPDILNLPKMFAAIHVASNVGPGIAKVLQGPTPRWKVMSAWGKGAWDGTGGGGGATTFGLPHFQHCRFTSRFPFSTVSLSDPAFPLTASLTGWSPFVPRNADDSSLPVAMLEYELQNEQQEYKEGVFYFASRNFMRLDPPAQPGTTDSIPRDDAILPIPGGFALWQPPWALRKFCARVTTER